MANYQTENDYVSLVRIPRKWFNLFVWSFSTVIVVNTLVELLTDWSWKGLGETTSTRTAVLMTLIVGWFFILSHIWEVIMLGYAKLYKDKVRFEVAKQYHHAIVEWNRRRIQAEKEGKEFTEPIPEPQEIIKSKKS